MTKLSDKPFKKALLEVLGEKEISQRELVRRTRKQSRWGSTGTIANLMSADIGPSVPALEAISKALEIRPEYFAEYRLAKARTALDPNVVGVRNALNGLGAARDALAGK